MQTYEIWAEGFVITGGSGQAHLVGTSEGTDFKDACIRWYKDHPLQALNFNPDTLTDWGCGLFPSEAQARARFG